MSLLRSRGRGWVGEGSHEMAGGASGNGTAVGVKVQEGRREVAAVLVPRRQRPQRVWKLLLEEDGAGAPPKRQEAAVYELKV